MCVKVGIRVKILFFFTVNTARSQQVGGVKRERPKDLPRSSTKKGKRPPRIPFRANNPFQNRWGPPRPPSPPRNPFDFNYFERRKEPFIPVELHPPILERPKPENAARKKPKSRPAKRPKSRRVPTTTIPTTEFQTTELTTTLPPATEPPTSKAPVKTTVKQIPVVKTTQANLVPATAPKVNNVQTRKQNLPVGQKPAPSVDASSPVQSGQPVNNEPFNDILYRPIITGSKFGQNKIPRPPPPPAHFQRQQTNVAPLPTRQSQPKQSTNMIQRQANQNKRVAKHRNLFRAQKGQSVFRRPSDIPNRIKPQVISYLSTRQNNQPIPSSPQIFSKGNKVPSISTRNRAPTSRESVPPSQPFAVKQPPPANSMQFGQKKDISYSVAMSNPMGPNPNLVGLERRPGLKTGENNLFKTDAAPAVPVTSPLGINMATSSASQPAPASQTVPDSKPVTKFDRSRVAQQIVGPSHSGDEQSLVIPLSQQTSNKRPSRVFNTRTLSGNAKMSSIGSQQPPKPALQQLTNTEFSKPASIDSFSPGQQKQNEIPLRPTAFIPNIVGTSRKKQQSEFFASGTYASQVLPSSDPSVPVLQQPTQPILRKKASIPRKSNSVMRVGAISKQSFRKPTAVVGALDISSQAVKQQMISTSVESNHFGGHETSMARNGFQAKQPTRQSQNTEESVLSSQVVPQQTQPGYDLTSRKDISSAGTLGVRSNRVATVGPLKQFPSPFPAPQIPDLSRPAVQQRRQSQTYVISPNKGVSSTGNSNVRHRGTASNGSPSKQSSRQSLTPGKLELSQSTGKQQTLSETHILSSNKGKSAKNTIEVRNRGSGSVISPPKQSARHTLAAWKADLSRQSMQKQPYSTLAASFGIPTTNSKNGMSSGLSKSASSAKKPSGQTPVSGMSNIKLDQSGNRRGPASRQQTKPLLPDATNVKLTSSGNGRSTTPLQNSLNQKAFEKQNLAASMNKLPNLSTQQPTSLQSQSKPDISPASLSRSKPRNSQQSLNSAENLVERTKLAQTVKTTKQDGPNINSPQSATEMVRNVTNESPKQTNHEQKQLKYAQKNVNENSSNQTPMKPNKSTGTSTSASQSRLQKVGNLMLQAFSDFLSKFHGVSPVKRPISSTKPMTKGPPGEMTRTETKANVEVSKMNAKQAKNAPSPKGLGMQSLKSENRQSASNHAKNAIGVDRPGSRPRSGGNSKTVRSETKTNMKKSGLQNGDSQSLTGEFGRKFGLLQSNKESKNVNVGNNSSPKNKKKAVNSSKAIIPHRLSNVVKNKSPNKSKSSVKENVQGTAGNKVSSGKGSRAINQNNIKPKNTVKETGVPSTEVIRGPPPPSFRRGKKPRTGKKGRRVNKPRKRVIERDPPGFNVPPSAHPPVLTRPEGTGSVTGEKVSSNTVTSGQGVAQNSVATSQEQLAVRTNPVQASCSLSPVCGSDGFTYMSNCFLWE